MNQQTQTSNDEDELEKVWDLRWIDTEGEQACQSPEGLLKIRKTPTGERYLVITRTVTEEVYLGKWKGGNPPC